jgi:hypothetical protein
VQANAGGKFAQGYVVMALQMLATPPRRSVATVPDVRWMPVPQARGVLQAAELTLEIGDSISNPTVAAGAVVVKDVPAYALVAGVPARRIGWVGESGVPLVAGEGEKTWVCPSTGAHYIETDGTLTKETV